MASKQKQAAPPVEEKKEEVAEEEVYRELDPDYIYPDHNEKEFIDSIVSSKAVNFQ